MINPMTSPQDQRLALSVIEVRDLIKAGKATSTEITRLCLARIEECKGLNALNTVCADYALAAAADIDARAARGDTRGLLFGVPVVIKDNLCTIGIRTTASSQILENFVPAYDAEVVTRLKKEGAVIVGKANMDEFAMGSSNETSSFGVVHNPHDPDRVPGGSSGGSAAAVA
ncbi:MAG: Asp-tRNA(Asn)/Glu-tRNA(Gln) amidotransferase subunit GatA, partial [Clostridiales bacterium]|nr:Asp-tRNA(Asn)/Glu-tRNA(Gln) amidotransferase subunit GatA [Clostridiales bacterium]